VNSGRRVASEAGAGAARAVRHRNLLSSLGKVRQSIHPAHASHMGCDASGLRCINELELPLTRGGRLLRGWEDLRCRHRGQERRDRQHGGRGRWRRCHGAFAWPQVLISLYPDRNYPLARLAVLPEAAQPGAGAQCVTFSGPGSAENKRQPWVPEGFAHGFVVLLDVP
jgi:hypothetical protein